MRSKSILLSIAMLGAVSANAQQWVGTNGQKHVMLYEGSGAWCMHCSDGAVYVEKQITKYGDKVVAISVHNNDGMSTVDGNVIDGSLKRGWPWGSVDMEYFNALKLQYIPGDPADTANISLNRGLWDLAITQRLAVAPKFDILMKHSFNKTTRELTVNVEVTALADATGDYNVNVFLTEDKVKGPDNPNYNQVNASTYNNNSNHPLYNKNNNAAKTAIIGFEHNHVVRASLGGPWGVQGPKNVKKGNVFKHEFKYTIPQKMGFTQADELTVNLNNMHLAAVVHGRIAGTGVVANPKNSQVENAVGAKMFPWNPNDIENVKPVAQVQIFPNPAGSAFMMKAFLVEPGDVQLSIMNMVGQTVMTKTYSADTKEVSDVISTDKLNSGIYMVNVTRDGQTTSQRLVISK